MRDSIPPWLAIGEQTRKSRGVPITQLLHLWAFRALFIGLPIGVAPAVSSALEAHSSSLTWLVAIALWLAWGLGLVALLVPNPLSLTAIRLLSLSALLAALVAAADDSPDTFAITWAAATFIWSMNSIVGALYVDAASYGDERRFALRVPGQLLMGPIIFVTSMFFTGISVGPILLATEDWLVGVPATVVGFFLALQGFRILHQLSQRWLIFVPTGVVLVDPMQLNEPLRMHKNELDSLRIAEGDSKAHDLSFGSLGKAIEISLDTVHPVSMRKADDIDSDTLLVAPTRLLDALEEASARKLKVS